MNFANNNKEVLKKLTRRSLKSNKVRNLFTIIAIVLTTFMISSVFSIGVSFIRNYKTMQLRMQGNTANVALGNATEKQIEKLKDLNFFSSMGYEINAGKIISSKLEKGKLSVHMQYYSKDDWDNQIKPCISNIEGNYPVKENEVMLSEKALEFLGLENAKIGDKIPLSYKLKLGGKKELGTETKNSEFILSGIYRNYAYTEDTGNVLVAEQFIKNNNLSLENDGSLYMKVKNKYKDNIEDMLAKEVQLNKGQEFRFNDEINNDSLEMSIKVAILVLVIVSFLILSGYLLIYNVIYISVIKDINFYGLLKTIGTSPKQIKKIVKGQALIFSIIGIPIGLVLGGVVSFGIVPLVISNFFNGTMSNAMPTDVSFNPVIFIAATLFSLLAVILSCRKPAKIASNISPVEALRYTGIKDKKKKGERKSTNGGKLYKMAWYNIFREKKRAIIVFLSLFMGIISFLSVNTFLKSINVENYINKYVKNDFQIENNNLSDKLSNDEIENIRNMKGVSTVETKKVAEMEIDLSNNVFLPLIRLQFENGGLKKDEINKLIEEIEGNPNLRLTQVIGIDENIISKYNKHAENKINIEDFKLGKIALVQSAFLNSQYNSEIDNFNGKELNLKSKNNEKSGKFIMELADDKEGVLKDFGLFRATWMPAIYISDSALEKLSGKTTNYMVNINIDTKYGPIIKNKLEQLTKSSGSWLTAKSSRIEDFKNMTMTINILGGGVSLILILIGLLNFINVMITGVNARLKEFAIMESIGMTKKQIKKVLMFEGLYYASITVGFILTIGIGIIYGISILSKAVVDYAIFVFPTIPLLILIISIFIVCLVTPNLVFKISSRKTITEKLREIEN